MTPRPFAITILAFAFLCSAVAARPAGAQAVEPSLADQCSGLDAGEPPMTDITTAFGLAKKKDALAALAVLEEPVRAAAIAAPDDVAAQYHLAAWLGARAERDGGRSKISAASEMQTQALRVLALAPQHAGANYLMGRLHAGVMRMSGLSRFFATHLLGGGALKGASWSASQGFLEAAVSGGPCRPEYHFELARLYGERDQPEAAERERLLVLELTEDSDGPEAVIRSRAEALQAEWAKKRQLTS